MDHVARLRRLQPLLSSNKLDFLLVTHLPNVRYLTGFTGSSGVLLVARRSATFFTDGRYIAQAKEEVRNARIVIQSKPPMVAAAEWLAAQRKKSAAGPTILGIESESLSAGSRDRLAHTLRGKVQVRSAPPLVERARMIKDASEIRLIREAIELGASLFPIACEKIGPGVPEVEVAAAMEYEARRRGAEGMSFPTILASGKRSAVVHGRASGAPIPRSGFVVCDFGVILAGYCSDRTRTVHVGKPPGEARQLYGAVLEAQSAAIHAVRAGVTCAEVDEAARAVLRKSKLGDYFTHSTGHGLGLEIHEAPRVAAGQTQKLESGMVVTIEPGAYIPGKWGVRIEDVVVVTPSGCEVLCETDNDLIVI
ncbi:MAG: Xaa-Pro peptidase family protein [Terriglobales bacterium]